MRIFAYLTLLSILLNASIQTTIASSRGEKNRESAKQIEVYDDGLDYIILSPDPDRDTEQPPMSKRELRLAVDKTPPFALHKSTFFTTGIPLHKEITRNTADALFQISIRQRLTKSILPLQTFLYFTYTQKSFINLYAKSVPFKDNNYTPAIGFGRYIVRKGEVKGAFFLQMEHDSNGHAGETSRSWNLFSLSIKYFFNPRFAIYAKAWVTYIDEPRNKSISDYRGVGYVALDYLSPNNRWWLSTEITPRRGWGNFNIMVDVAFKAFKSQNQYLYARFYNGRADYLLNYREFECNIRFGFCVKPKFTNIY